MPELEFEGAVVGCSHAFREVRHWIHLGVELHQGVVEAPDDVELGDERRLSGVERVDHVIACDFGAQRRALRQSRGRPSTGERRGGRATEEQRPAAGQVQRSAVHCDLPRSRRGAARAGDYSTCFRARKAERGCARLACAKPPHRYRQISRVSRRWGGAPRARTHSQER